MNTAMFLAQHHQRRQLKVIVPWTRFPVLPYFSHTSILFAMDSCWVFIDFARSPISVKPSRSRFFIESYKTGRHRQAGKVRRLSCTRIGSLLASFYSLEHFPADCSELMKIYMIKTFCFEQIRQFVFCFEIHVKHFSQTSQNVFTSSQVPRKSSC